MVKTLLRISEKLTVSRRGGKEKKDGVKTKFE
jgi:hypothetical protein